MLKHLFRYALLLFFVVITSVSAFAGYEGEDLGYIDVVTLNGERYNDFENKPLVFYPGDLTNGEIIVRGIVESEQKSIGVDDLVIQATMDGGETWQDAKGNGRWVYRFTPEMDTTYYFNLRVVRKNVGMEIFDDYPLNTHVVETGNVYQLGEFLLTTAATAVENKLTGEATLALGWLGQFVPENLKKPGTDDLILNVTDLEIEGKKIINGSVVFEPDFTFNYSGASFTLTALAFTKDGASAAGSIVLPELVVPSAPEISFSDLEFSPSAINYTLPLVKPIDPIKNFEIISGVYGVKLALSELSVRINSTKDIPISLASLDGSILLGSGYGGVSIPNLQLLENQLLSYGTKAAAGTVSTGQNVASKITIPHTDFTISDLGGSISLQDKSVSLSGAFNFPAEFGGGSVTLPAATPLLLSTSGISTAGMLEFDAGNLPSLDLSGFPTSLETLSLAIADNIPSGSLNGQVILTSFADLPLDIVADINQDGLNSFRLAVTKDSYSFNLADFATLSLSKLALEYDAGGFSVEMDGSITPTSDLVSSITGIGESLVFEGLTIAEDAITLANDLAGWHGLNGASAEIEGAILILSHYGIGVDNNKFWLGLKGDGSLAGAQVNATARVFHDGSTELSGLDLKSLRLNFGDFLLKVERSAVDAEGMINGAEGTIAGLPDIVINKFPELFNEASELLVQLNGLKVDIANRKVSLGSVTLNPSESLDFDLGPVQMALSGMTFSTTGAEIDGSISLAGIGLSAEDIPFEALQFGKTGFAGEIDLVGQTGVLMLEVLSGDYGFGLELRELKVAVDTALPLAEMVQLAELAGALQFGSGYDDLRVENLQLLASNAIAWGRSVAVEGQQLATSVMTIPGTDFKLIDLGGSINLTAKSVALSGKFQFPAEFGAGSVTLPAATPLVLSTNGISTTGTLVFDVGNLPSLDLSGFPTSLETLSLAIADNIPSGSLSGEVVLTSFASLPLDIAADISADGLQSVRLAVEKDTYSFDLADFATLSLTKLALGYDAGDFSVEMDGSITPTNSLLSSVTGIGESLTFEGLTIANEAITLASSLAGWHDLSGASAQVEGANLSLIQYGVGVEENKFWVGLKGRGSLVGAQVNATARIFHDGTTELSGIDLDHLYLSLGDFGLKVARNVVDESGAVLNGAAGTISGLPDLFAAKFPGLFNENGELVVQLNGLNVDIANRQVTLGSVSLAPTSPLSFNLGPVAMQLTALTFNTSSASIDGSITLDGLGLPTPNLPFSALQFGRNGFAGEIDLIGSAGLRTIDVVEGEFGFGVDLTQLTIAIDSQQPIARMVQLRSFGGSLRFGSGFGGLSIPDLQLSVDGAIRWGKNQAAGIMSAGQRLVLPGNLFSISELGGSINLAEKELTISGALVLPPELGSAQISIPADKPLMLSAKDGLSTSGPLVFTLGDLPSVTLAHIDSQLTALSIDIDHGAINGSLNGDMNFEQFGGLKVAVMAAVDSEGLSALVIDSDQLNRSFDLAGFATLGLTTVSTGIYDHHFYVQIDGTLTATHELFADYGKTVNLNGLRIFKNGISFVSEMAGWKKTEGASVEINSARLALQQYGLGVEDGQLWFGLKGEASYQSNSFDLTARIFQDGRYEISDFSFDGLTLSLGDFSLRTAAQLVAGKINGDGFINAGFLNEFIPASMKDPVTGELMVNFSDLGVDLDAKSVTSGNVTVNFPSGMTVTLPAVQAVLRSISFGTAGAAVDGDIALTSIGGIDLPDALSDLSFGDIALKPAGLLGVLNWPAVGSSTVATATKGAKRGVSAMSAAASGPLTIPVVTGEYGLTLKLTSVELDLDTTKSSVFDMVKLTDLDGSIELGSGY
ncbi:MAG: hypothetical protein JRG71_04805, partial [Deltaproteobacteria bacterium]|nr:hypothetical protein [Deltaproteobacteria bacterium]